MRDKQGTLCYDAEEDIGSADDLLQHAHVTVYPVDPRALDILAKNDPTSRIVRLQNTDISTWRPLPNIPAARPSSTTTTSPRPPPRPSLQEPTTTPSPTPPPIRTGIPAAAPSLSKSISPVLTSVYKDSYNAYPPGATTTPGGRPIEKATPLQSAMMRGALQPSEVLFHVSVAHRPGAESRCRPATIADPKDEATLPASQALLQHRPQRLSSSTNCPTATTTVNLSMPSTYTIPATANSLNSNVMAAKPALPPAVYQSMLAWRSQTPSGNRHPR